MMIWAWNEIYNAKNLYKKRITHGYENDGAVGLVQYLETISGLMPCNRQAFWLDSWARVYKRERQMAKAHLHEGIFHSPRYIMT